MMHRWKVPLRSARLRAALCLAMLLLPLLPVTAQQPTSAQMSESELERRTREVAAQLRCPVCQGNSIQDSPSELAQEMKGVVRDQLAAGRTPNEVKQYFIDKYGEWVLLEPTASGFNLLVYVLPVLMLLGGAFVIVRAVRKWTTAPPAADGTT
ncbi:MAG: cytochrome c-type biogenesis protein [Gemmatimonadaceae bacterium]